MANLLPWKTFNVPKILFMTSPLKPPYGNVIFKSVQAIYFCMGMLTDSFHQVL